MGKKICNQFFIKDSHRNRKHAGTIKCVCCLEESNFSEPFPFSLTYFTEWLENFSRMHTDKGCNKKALQAPEWAAKEVDMDIVA